jgi:hypothetical protein
MAKYIRRSDDGEVRVLSEEERNAEDESASQSTVALISAAVCTLAYLATIGIETPIAKAGAIAVGIASLALGAALYRYILGLIGLLLIAGLCFTAFSWVISEDEPSEKVDPVTIQEPVVVPDGVTSSPEASSPVIVDLPASQTAASTASFEPEQTVVANGPDTSGQFIYAATLVDSRGKIVLQSEPRMTAKNVATLPSGASVRAKTKDGKWIEIQTNDGLTGFVRLRQLSFINE